MTAHYQFIMNSGPTPGKVFPLEGDVITIGRENENNIVIVDAEVSRKHCQLISQGGKFILTDLGSTNGTFVNMQRLTGQHVLQPGELISLGEQISLVFEAIVQTDPNATMISSGHAPEYIPPVSPAPAPRPPVQKPMPQPAYAGQIPSGPSPIQPAPAKSANSRIILIVVIVVLLCIICSCAGFLWYVDSNSLWCNFFPFLFPGGCGG